MSHLHSTHDDDLHFLINSFSREIVYDNRGNKETLIISKSDHNSERFTFELPRYIEGHDMLECNAVQVHYINISSSNKNNQNVGIYEVADLQINPDNPETLLCSWLLSQNATTHIGSLSFTLRFACMSGYQINYQWSTTVFSAVTIADSINNSDTVATQYTDILEKWHMELMLSGNAAATKNTLGIADALMEKLETEDLKKVMAPLENVPTQVDSVVQSVSDIPDGENHVYADHSVAFGIGNTVGRKGYGISFIDTNTKTLHLDKQKRVVISVGSENPYTDPLTVESGYEAGDEFEIWIIDSEDNISRWATGTIESLELGVIHYSESIRVYENQCYVFSVSNKPEAGEQSVSISTCGYAEGNGTTASGPNSHAEGYRTIAFNINTHAEGDRTTALGQGSHAEGNATTASGTSSHAEGNATTASSTYSHAEGSTTTASGQSSHAEGDGTEASGRCSHAEGNKTTASGVYSHAEGYRVTASGTSSHAEGQNTTASSNSSHAEGDGTTASGTVSHAEGTNTTASNIAAHAEGNKTTASGTMSHAEGYNTTASGSSSHVGGAHSTSVGACSFAHGDSCNANAEGSVALGIGVNTSPTTVGQCAVGVYNDNSNANTLFAVGNGTAPVRTNAFEIRSDGRGSGANVSMKFGGKVFTPNDFDQFVRVVHGEYTGTGSEDGVSITFDAVPKLILIIEELNSTYNTFVECIVVPELHIGRILETDRYDIPSDSGDGGYTSYDFAEGNLCNVSVSDNTVTIDVPKWSLNYSGVKYSYVAIM